MLSNHQILYSKLLQTLNTFIHLITISTITTIGHYKEKKNYLAIVTTKANIVMFKGAFQ